MKQVKQCSKCREFKSLGDFSKDNKNKGGLNYKCKPCKSKVSKKYRHTESGLVAVIYDTQKGSSKRRNHIVPNYTKEELKNWIFSQPNFIALFNNWKLSGFNRDLRPSCDRKKSDKPYTLDNLELMTWEQNKSNGHRDMRLGIIINGVNPQKPVVGVHIETGEVVEFCSTMQARRKLGVDNSSISKVCIGKKVKSSKGNYFTPQTAGGYKWYFKENYNLN